jgi:catechol-2,3-dioxygenase
MTRVTDIRYVGYGVADFEAERRFYAETWGLDEVAAQDDMAWFKAQGDDEHHVVRLRAARASRRRRLSPRKFSPGP